MPVTQSLTALKDLEEAYRPTLLFTITFSNGTSVYVTSASNGLTGSVAWNGHNYVTAITGQNIGGLGAQSGIGLDIFPQIGLQFADADATWWSLENLYGFQGALLVADFVYYDPNANQFSTTSKRIFTGVCDPATQSGNTTSITAFAKNSLQKVFLPNTPIQRTCPHNFPSTFAQRAEANNPFSIYYKCGYSPDQANGTGNFQSGSTPYTGCPRDVSSCKARGQYTFDSLGHDTHRYGGVQWDPPATFKGKQYTSGKQVQGVNNANPQKWKQVAPINFGTVWVTCLQANGVGDPNSTRGEFIVSSESLEATDPYRNIINDDFRTVGVQQVVVNGLLIPEASQSNDLLLRWYKITSGMRQGAPNQTAIYNGTSDPYGSLAVIMPIVYQQVASSNTDFSVQALVGERAIPVYSDSSTYSLQRTSNLAWNTLEILRMLRPDMYAQIDIASVISYATTCATGVGYTNLYGQSTFHERYRISLALTEKNSGQTIIESLKIAGKMVIVPSADGLKLRMVGKQTLSEQQGTPVPGSNDNTPTASYRAYDNPTLSPTGTGYYAYYFNESTYIEGSIQIAQDGISSTPVVLQCDINDEDNDHTQDSVTIGDSTAYDRTGQLVQAALPVIGLPNYDQAYRCGETYQAERYRGNPRADSGGTYRITLETTSRAITLNQADIVAFSNARLQIAKQAFRVEGISPSQKDLSRVQYVLRWHEDAWYTDQYGQLPSPYVAQYLGSLGQQRVPYPWAPGGVGNVAADSAFGLGAGSYWSFQIQVSADQLFDNTIAPQFTVTGRLPLNKPVTGLAPRIARQGSVSTSGGVLPNGITLFAYVAAIDGSGNESPVGILPSITSIPGASGTNSVSLPVLSWPSGTTGYRVYSGQSPLTPAFSGSGSGTPSSVTITGYQTGYSEPVDPFFDHFVLKAKRVTKPGYLYMGPGYTQRTLLANGLTATTITFSYSFNLNTNQFYSPLPNELAGRTIMSVYQTDGGQVAFLNLKVASNTGLAVTIDETSGFTDLTATGNLSQAWFIVAHHIGSLAPAYVQTTNNSLGTDTTGLVGSMVRVIAGPGAGQPLRTITVGTNTGAIYVDQAFSPALSTSSIIVVEEAAWAINTPQASQAISSTSAVTTMQAGFDNKSSQAWLVQVVGADQNGNETPNNLCPFRLFFWPGQQPDQTIFQGQNLVPNADFSLSGSPGEIVAGYYVISNGQNAWRASTSSSIVYGGGRSIWYHMDGISGGYQVTSTGGLNISSTTTMPLALPVPGASYYLVSHGRCTTNVSSFTIGGVQPVYEFRITVRYSDGTFDDTGVTGTGFDSTNYGTWIENHAYFTISNTKTPVELFLNIGAYIASPDTENVMFAGQTVDVYISSIALYRVLSY